MHTPSIDSMRYVSRLFRNRLAAWPVDDRCFHRHNNNYKIQTKNTWLPVENSANARMGRKWPQRKSIAKKKEKLATQPSISMNRPRWFRSSDAAHTPRDISATTSPELPFECSRTFYVTVSIRQLDLIRDQKLHISCIWIPKLEPLREILLVLCMQKRLKRYVRFATF